MPPWSAERFLRSYVRACFETPSSAKLQGLRRLLNNPLRRTDRPVGNSREALYITDLANSAMRSSLLIVCRD